MSEDATTSGQDTIAAQESFLKTLPQIQFVSDDDVSNQFEWFDSVCCFFCSSNLIQTFLFVKECVVLCLPPSRIITRGISLSCFLFHSTTSQTKKAWSER